MECWKTSSELRKYVFDSLKEMESKPYYHKGQNFLISASIINFQVDHANIKPSDTILEIGGGVGNLTRCLVNRAKFVYVIESDIKFAGFLSDKFSTSSNVEVIQGDAVKVEFPTFTKCVSNLPYQISSPITFKLLEKKFDFAILMFQREFAQRFFAKVGTKDYSRLTVMINLKSECQYLKTVKPSSFYPAPKIDSAIVSMKRKEKITVNMNSDFDNFITLIFSHKKKILRSIITNLLKRKGYGELRNKIVNNLPYLERRIFTLSLVELIDLYKFIRTKIGEDLWSDIFSLNMK
ncbi:MAG: ribosomal RNA small subunit methyltransferase A [Asgard group archaeon]|nr:ribosomal RNA small subunit methyltransferase A [Asgard group archaeon]